MSEIKLNLEQIKEYQQNRHPYLFVDYIEKLVPGKISNGYKMLSKDEWFGFIGQATQTCQVCFKSNH